MLTCIVLDGCGIEHSGYEMHRKPLMDVAVRRAELKDVEEESCRHLESFVM